MRNIFELPGNKNENFGIKWSYHLVYTAQKMKFSIKDFLSKYDQIRSFLPIWPPLLKK